MSEIIIIAAVAQNNVIGKGNDIPWYIKEDFKHFKDITMGYPVLMGSNTYESLPIKPLPGRLNIVLDFEYRESTENVIYKTSLDAALEYCRNEEKIFIIGGGSVYKICMDIADKLEITRIWTDVEGDVFFPEIDMDVWNLVKREDHTDEKYGDYSFMTYVRDNK